MAARAGFEYFQERKNDMALVKALAIASLGLWAWTSASAQAQHHGEHEHGKPVEFKMPATYKAAVREILLRLHEIEELMASKKLDQVHPQADVIRKVGDVVGQLALKADSGVPRESVKEVNKAGRELAAKFDAIDKVADAGDAAGTRKVFGEMKKLVETLQKHAPREYACPMRCEGEKVYAKPEDCPECGMKLQDVLSHLDHSAKHGGIFFMASDQKHHLEGTLSDKREFRLYFYDEYTKAIPADKFTAEGKAWRAGQDAEKPLAMRVEPGKAFLCGPVDSSIAFPMRIKVFIDFKDGQKPQCFDFEFAEATASPAEHDTDKANDAGGRHDNEKHGARGG